MDEGPRSAERRRARLHARVAELTREFRATIRSEEEFAVVLVRGTPVDHRLHATGLLIAFALGVVLALSIGFFFGDGGVLHPTLDMLEVAVVVPASYALFWLFLAATGGEEFERLSVDEHGNVSSVKYGRSVDTRADVLRVGIPAILIALSGWNAVALIRDIAIPPRPNCVTPAVRDDDYCMPLLNINGLVYATAWQAPTPGPNDAPGAVATPEPILPPPGAGEGFTLAGYREVERNVRILWLGYTSAVLLPSVWFLWCMLTGRWVLAMRPVRGRRREDE